MGGFSSNRSRIIPGALISSSYISDIYDVFLGNKSENVIITGSLTVTGSLKVNGSITGSLYGTSTSASRAISAETASYVSNSTSASYASISVSSSYSDNAISSSLAQTSSYAIYALTASYALNGGSGASTLTASYFDSYTSLVSSSVEQTIFIDTIYDLSGSTLDIGANKTLVFNDGGFQNGTIKGTNCSIVAGPKNIFISASVNLTGSWITDIYPEWWSTKSTTNWQPALQAALDTAYLTSGKVKLSAYRYNYYGQLTINEGVTLEGVSKGNTAFGSGPTKGSVLKCLGNISGSLTYGNIAIKIIGRMTTLRDFTLLGERSVNRHGDGILYYGVSDGSSLQGLLENSHLENILVHGFEKGKGVAMFAGNSGAVTYSNFFNLRIRDCAYGLYIHCFSSNPIYNNTGSTGLPYTSATGFLNSNNFSGLYISGYAECCLWVKTEVNTLQANSQDVYVPANNHLFSGVVIESQYAVSSSIRIEGAGSQVRMHDIRLEATQQDSHFPDVPTVYLGPGTTNNYLDCDQMSVRIQDLGYNNTIIGHNMKAGNPSPNAYNLYKNSALVGLDKTGIDVSLPEWTIQEQYIGTGSYAWKSLAVTSSITISQSSYLKEYGYNTLSVSVPPDYQFRMYQDIDRTLHDIKGVTINAYVSASANKDVTWTYQDELTPIVSMGPTWGNSGYEPIGGYFQITSADSASYYRIALFCQNYTTSSIDFSFTMPSFTPGYITPKIPAAPLLDTGFNTVYGPLAYNVVKNIQPISNPLHNSGVSTIDVVLPNEGNYFEINEECTIQKINATLKRFPRGSVITLYFNYANCTLVDSAYINLNKPFTSKVGSVITLQQPESNGLWRELSRTEKQISGLTSVEFSGSFNTSSYLTLDTAYNIFSLTNSGSITGSIARINYTNRFDAGTEITLQFPETSSLININNSAYINLYRGAQFIPSASDWIKLQTNGDGTWNEIARKQSNLYIAKYGLKTVDPYLTITSSNLVLPTTGENIFKISSSAASQSFSKINQLTGTRFEPGAEITLQFTGSNSVTLTNSAYMTLYRTSSFTAVNGDWITFKTIGDGTWFETNRNQSLYNVQKTGYASINVQNYISASILQLPTTGENSFRLDNSGSPVTINRINQAAGTRLEAGSIIFLTYNITSSLPTTQSITMANSSYINLLYSGSYTPNNGDWQLLQTTNGDGTWVELARKPQMSLPTSNTVTLSSANFSSNFLTLPMTGENYFNISAASLGGTINRINYAVTGSYNPRFKAGTQIWLEFTNLTNAVYVASSSFIILSGSTHYTASLNGGLVLWTRGDGTWRELSRF